MNVIIASKTFRYISLTILFIVVAIAVLAGRSMTSRNEAAFSGQACRSGSCSIDTSKMNQNDFGKWKLTAYKNGTSTPIGELIINSSQDSAFTFPVDDMESRYECRFEPVDKNSGLSQVCGSTAQQLSCGPGQCACDISGGLDCSDRTESFVDPREDGPGMIIINPRYNGPPDSCFVCDEIVFRDSSTEKSINARFDCQGNWLNYNGPLPAPTGIRLHQAHGQACRTYVGMVIGHNPTLTPELTPNPVVCGDCQAQVCCPACTKPLVLPVPGSSDVLSCAQNKCNFEILNGDRCLAIGEELQVKMELQRDGACIYFDDEFAQDVTDSQNNNRDNKVCGLKNNEIVTFKYVDGGVYDISLDCDPGHTNPLNIPSSRKNELVCRKRISASCTIEPIGPSGTPSPTPRQTLTPTSTPTSTPTGPVIEPPLCPLEEKLNVRISCPNCDQ